MKHTLGPWIRSGWRVLGHLGYEIADCDKSGILPVEERHANARLIEAAPAMYEALQRIAAYPSGGYIIDGTPAADRFEMIHIAREVTFKLEGRKPV